MKKNLFHRANNLLRQKKYGAAAPIYRVLAEQRPEFIGYEFWLNYCQRKLPSKLEIPLVSIIMPTFNRSEVIETAIDSVIRQTHKNWELIIIDDGSTDSTSTIIQPFLNDSRIHYHKNTRLGVSSARNYGLAKSKGDYIAYLDTDNEWTEIYLESMTSEMIRSNAVTAYAGITCIKQNGQQEYRFKNYDYNGLKERNHIDLNVFMHKKSVYTLLGGFDPQLFRMVDWDLILKYCGESPPLEIDLNGCAYSDGDDPSRITNSVKSSFLTVKHRYTPLVDWVKESTKTRSPNKTSIIIPFIDNPKITIECIKSVLKNSSSHEFEIILVDNGSSSECMGAVKAELNQNPDPRITYIRNPSNLNFSLGNNVGFRNSSGEFIVFLNNDTTVTPGWLMPLLDTLKKDEAIGFVQPLLLYPDGTVQGGIVAFSPFSVVPYHLYAGSSPDDSVYASGRTVSTATAACLAVRASDFAKLNGFDSIYINGCEDTDLCLRYKESLNKHGYFEPSSIVYHHESKSQGRHDHFNSNRLAFCTRWKDKLITDDINHMLRDGYFPTAYNPKERLSSGLPWIRRIDNPTLQDLSHLKNGRFALLVVKPSGIGNMILFLPALISLKKTYPEAHITVLSFKAESSFIENYCDDTLTIERSKDGRANIESLDSVLAGKKFDCVIYPPYSGISEPKGALGKVSSIHLTHPFVTFESRHEALHNIDLAMMLGANKEYAAFPPLHAGSIESHKKIWGHYAVIHVGSSTSPHMLKKRWPNKKWAELIDKLSPQLNRIIFVGSQDDINDTREIKSLISRDSLKNSVNLINSTSFSELTSIIGGAAIFISNDSGLMHLASMTDVRMISIFGPTNPAKNRPWRDHNCIVITPERVACAPCYTSDPKTLNSCSRQMCLESISVERVLDSALHLLGEEASFIEKTKSS